MPGKHKETGRFPGTRPVQQRLAINDDV